MSEHQPVRRRDPVLVRMDYEHRIRKIFDENWRVIGGYTAIPVAISTFTEVVSPVMSIPVPAQIEAPMRLFSGIVATAVLMPWLYALHQAKQLDKQRTDELRRLTHP